MISITEILLIELSLFNANSTVVRLYHGKTS